MTPKRRNQVILRAIKRMHAAADSLYELMEAADEVADAIGKPMPAGTWEQEQRFASDLRERAVYWESARWWQS